MSNYCSGCRFDPAQSTGPKACPFTTLYWDYLLQHEPKLRQNQRMSMQVRNLARLDESKREGHTESRQSSFGRRIRRHHE
jgi:deoxyribodipyrimidine photolyase-related protein